MFISRILDYNVVISLVNARFAMSQFQKTIVCSMKYAILLGNKIEFLLLFIAFY